MTDVSTGSFAGAPWPADVLAQVWATVLTGAPFSQAITPLPTIRGSVAFPKVAPSGAAFVKELDPLPAVDLNSDADVVAAVNENVNPIWPHRARLNCPHPRHRDAPSVRAWRSRRCSSFGSS